MVEEDDVFGYTTSLKPGIYKYQFNVDGEKKADPSNRFSENGKSVLYMPGLIGGAVQVKANEATELPTYLTQLMADGTEKLTAVEYSTDKEGVTLSGNTVTVTGGEDSVDLTATAGDLTATVELYVRENRVVSPVVSGNEVTFYYEGDASVTGSMNNWKVQEMKNDGAGVSSCTMKVAPGVYTYKFIVDGKEIKDPLNICTSGDGSSLVVEGLVGAEYGAVKDKTFYLPKQLERFYEDGTSEMVDVSYSVTNANVDLDPDAKTIKFTEGEIGDTVELTATAADKTAVIKMKLVNDTNEITLKLHYDRPDNNYAGWNAWMWFVGKDGAQYDFAEENGEMVATIKFGGRDTTAVNYIVRKGNWEAKDIEEDRTMDVSDVVSGTVHYYVKSGVKEATRVLGDDALKGTKVQNAEYVTGKSQVKVTTSVPVTGDPVEVFAVKEAEGAEIAITEASVDGNVYTLTLAKDLASFDVLKQIEGFILSYDGYDYRINMQSPYSNAGFEELYTYDGELGALWTEEKTTFKLWAPTADEVKLNLYESGTDGTEDCIETLEMTKVVSGNGVWTVEKEGDLHGKYYTYTVDVNGKEVEACDPYARTTGVNGKRAMVINLDSTDPEGWDQDVSPNKDMNYTDAVIYELHVRDLSSDPNSGIKNTGKFLGLTEKGTKTPSGQMTGLDHLIDMGITHLHILPFYDYGSVDETKLDTPQFNWGYDPVNYNVPEGSYSTDPYNGEVRVKELKQTVKALHESNINVVMDVVYNHVYAAESFCFNQIVPQYFSRVNADGSYSNGSGCGNDTASERSMVKKYIVDSVKYWADEYHIDGFRFDLVGLIDTETINQIVEEVHATHPDVIFYGEGWTMGTTVTKPGYTMATQLNSTETPGFAYFSDTIRDSLRGSVFEATEPGFMVGATGRDQRIAKCLQAISEAEVDGSTVVWSTNPSQTVNYASCHDNHTLKDRINNTAPNASEADRIKMNNMAAVTYMTSQGIPFIHAGEEILRTKVHEDGTVEHNSYNSNDYVNMLRWTNLDKPEYEQVNEYYKGLIEFRKNHKALRLTTAEEVSQYVYTEVLDDNLILNIIDAKAVEGEVADGIVVIINANATDREVPFTDLGAEYGDWKICVNDQKAGTDVLGVITDGIVTVPAYSAMVLVKGETVDNNSIYAKNARLATVVLDKASAELKIGDTMSLTATVKPSYIEGATISWSTSDSSVATVNNAGLVTAVKPGTANITVTATATKEGKTTTCTATCKVTVVDPTKPVVDTKSIKLSETKMTIVKGNKATLTATVEPADAANKAVTWSSSDEKIATVDKDGNITAKKGGIATITAQTANGVKATCEVTVADVTLNATKMALQVGKSTTALKVETKWPSNDKVKSWKSSNKKVATVSSKGKIKGIKKGTATITVTMKSGATAKCKVTVQTKKVVTKKLTISQKKATLKKGKSLQLTVKRNPISATEKITWSTSNKKIATVSKKGKVKAKKPGKVTITAKTSNGKKVTCKITVKK